MTERIPPIDPRAPPEGGIGHNRTTEDLEFAREFPFPDAPSPPSGRAPAPVLSVAQLARAIRGGVDAAFPRSVLVRGEVKDSRPSSSGHIYFALKDEEEDATLDVVLYKTSITTRTRALVKDGARVRVRGKPSFWPPKGKLQLVSDRVDDEGKGALLEALEKLKASLLSEGIFAAERKRPLPSDPRVVGVVTSASGAVIHDIARVAARRGGAHVLLAAALVQGPGAAASMVRALKLVSRVRGVDVVILGRGGGSSDDLLAFSDEALVRAVAACRVPVVAAVGHDVDVPLVDFAADARAATPSQAAEMVVPDRAARRALALKHAAQLARAMRARLAEHRSALLRRDRSLLDPRIVLSSWQQKKDDLDARLSQTAERALRDRTRNVGSLSRRLLLVHPRLVLARERSELLRLTERMTTLAHARISKERGSTSSFGARLDALSPLKVLGRGYAIAMTKDGRAVRRASDVNEGEPLSVRVHEGSIEAVVSRKKRKEEP